MCVYLAVLNFHEGKSLILAVATTVHQECSCLSIPGSVEVCHPQASGPKLRLGLSGTHGWFRVPQS